MIARRPIATLGIALYPAADICRWRPACPCAQPSDL